MGSNGNGIFSARAVTLEFAPGTVDELETPLTLTVNGHKLSGIAKAGTSYVFQAASEDLFLAITGTLKIQSNGDGTLTVLLNAESGATKLVGIFPACAKK